MAPRFAEQLDRHVDVHALDVLADLAGEGGGDFEALAVFGVLHRFGERHQDQLGPAAHELIAHEEERHGEDAEHFAGRAGVGDFHVVFAGRHGAAGQDVAGADVQLVDPLDRVDRRRDPQVGVFVVHDVEQIAADEVGPIENLWIEAADVVRTSWGRRSRLCRTRRRCTRGLRRCW